MSAAGTALELTQEQQMLQDLARRFLAARISSAQLRAEAAFDPRYIADSWRAVVEMGWTGLLMSPDNGGPGLGLLDGAVLGEELGRALFPGPYMATVVLAGRLIEAYAPVAWRAVALDKIATGERRIALGWLDDSNQWLTRKLSLRVEGDALCGRKTLVEYPDSATHMMLIDTVKNAGGTIDFTAYLVASDAPGIRIEPFQPLDITCPIGTVECDSVPLAACSILSAEVTIAEFDRMLLPARLFIAAEMVGVAQAALNLAVAYAGERKQFGAPIGSFQAIKHRLADGHVAVEGARLAVRHAAALIDAQAEDPTLAVVAAWGCAAEAALKVSADCIQIHGGLGFSWDHDAHLYLKRARRLSCFLWNPQEAREQIARIVVATALDPQGELYSPIG